MNRRQEFVAVIGTVSLGMLLSIPGRAFATDNPKTAVTMGSVQIFHAIDSMQTLNISINGKVRARGVPRLSATAPLSVAAGTGVLSIAMTLPAGGTKTESTLALPIEPGARRTVFLTGTPISLQSVVVDAMSTDGTNRANGGNDRTLQVVDLRPPANRGPVSVGGKTHELSAEGVSKRFRSSGPLTVELGGISSPDVASNLTGPLLLVVTRAPDGDHVMAVRHNTTDINSLRTPVAPKIRVPGEPLTSLITAILVMVAATAMALSSMMVFRGRMREDRVRNRMAQTMGLG